MRLSEEERSVIREAVGEAFEGRARVWLFGSRVDDARHGGDIDLYVETDLPFERSFPARMHDTPVRGDQRFMALNEARAWLIAYDITESRRLRRVHRFCLRRAGVPAQYSVFAAHDTPARMRQLRSALADLIDRRCDDMRIYPIPANPELTVLGTRAPVRWRALPQGDHEPPVGPQPQWGSPNDRKVAKQPPTTPYHHLLQAIESASLLDASGLNLMP